MFLVLHSWKRTEAGKYRSISRKLRIKAVRTGSHGRADSHCRWGKRACLESPPNNKHALAFSHASFGSFGKIVTLGSQQCGMILLPGVFQNLLISLHWPLSTQHDRSAQCDGYAQKRPQETPTQVLWSPCRIQEEQRAEVGALNSVCQTSYVPSKIHQ